MSNFTIKPLHSVKRFYFLEYFYILLKSVEKYSDKEQVFNSFKTMKHEHRLGESKYKKLTAESENLTITQLNRYRFTYVGVIDEAKDYELISEDTDGNLRLTKSGRKLLAQYQNEGYMSFNHSLCKLMESRYNAFKYLIEFLYNSNRHRPGLLIFPVYSPRQLHIERATIKTTSHIFEYADTLANKLQLDISKHLGQTRNLKRENAKLKNKLIDSGLLSSESKAEFAPEKYNVILKRFRDFWLAYFLRQIYRYEYSLSSFDIWTYRGKQIGIIQATEFYPNFNGRLVYPTSVVLKSTDSVDFQKLYSYPDGNGLYMHNPTGEKNQDKFVDFLVNAYFDLRRSYRSGLPSNGHSSFSQTSCR